MFSERSPPRARIRSGRICSDSARERVHVAEERRLVGRHRLDDEVAQRSAGRASQLVDQPGDALGAALAHERQQAGLDQVLLAALQHDGGALPHHGADVLEVVRREAHDRDHPPAPTAVRPRATRRVMALATAVTGRTSGVRPAWTTAPGMPQTTEVASSWTTTEPPASTMRAAPRGAVRPHAGQDDGQHAAAVHLGGRAEQDVDGGAAVVLRRPLVEGGEDAVRVGLEPDVEVAGSDQDPTGLDAVAVLRLGHRERGSCRPGAWRTGAVKIGGMCCTTTTGTGRLPGSALTTVVRASGPPVETPMTTTSTGPSVAPGGRHRVGGAVLTGTGAGVGSDVAGPPGLDLGDELGPDGVHGRGDAAHVGGLGDVVVRAALEGLERGGGASLGDRREHDHRQVGVVLAQLHDGLEPVHHRHLDVEGDDVGVEQRDLRQGDLAVGGRPDDLDVGVARQDVRDESSYDDRVVDDEHADGGHGTTPVRGRAACRR